MQTTDQLIPDTEVAALLGCGVRRVRRLAASGALPAVKLGPKITRFSPQALKEFIERGGARPQERQL